MTAWTTPRDIADRIRRRWDDGSLPGSLLGGESLFPMRIPLRHPDSGSLLHRFSEALDWHKELEAGSRSTRGFGYEIEWKEILHRQIGRNRIAVAVSLPSEEDALRLIGKWEDADRFRRMVRRSLERFPRLDAWISRRPHKLLEHAAAWEKILAVVEWFRENPGSGLYMRQVDIPGVDTKFIENRKGLIREILDALASEESAGTGPGALPDFDSRFGLRPKPTLIRFGILDGSLARTGLTDISAPVDQIARLSIPVDHVFITENEINGLAFPPLPRSIVLFGLGYGAETLEEIPWLAEKSVHYWGDIDTHGFAILDRLRRILPDARSLLMDRETLLAHRNQWVEEPVAARKSLERLTVPEQELYRELISDGLGVRVRLEQERIAFGYVKKEVERAVA